LTCDEILFPKAWNDWMNEKWFLEIKENLETLIKKISKISDDRAIALVGALVIENLIDALLQAILPKYSILNTRDFSFYHKIKLCKALSLIPNTYLNGAIVIKDIRNDFAHDLNITSFNDLEPTLFQSIKDHLINRSIYGGYETINDLYIKFIQNTAVVLFMYQKKLEIFNKFIRQKNISEILLEFYKEQIKL